MNTEITSSIHYVGVNDRHKDIFEGLWPLPYGVSYNSYIIDDEKVALIDTVEVDFFPQFLANIRSVIGDRPIDYIIVNHVEPDHSGSLPLIKKYYPEARIVGNKKTFDMVRGYYNVGTGDDIVEVSNGDTLQLGKHTLSFTMIPMVHWPETMATLDQTANVLFSGDAFGCFGALAGAFVDADMNCDIYWDEMRRYYSNIVGKYGVPVQQALKKLAGVKIDFFEDDRKAMMEKYEKLLKVAAEQQLMVNFHGCTRPTGLRRTWPNLITSEAVYGGEQYYFNYLATPATHNITLALTRNVIGAMDYTPVEFARKDGVLRHLTTWSHQVALATLYESGIQTMSDSRQNLTTSPAAPLLGVLPAAWDETRCLEASPDQYVTVARRKGDDWYVASIANDERDVTLPLQQLLGDGTYTAQIYKDGTCPSDIAYDEQPVTAASTLALHVKATGGFTVRLTKTPHTQPAFQRIEAEEGTVSDGTTIDTDAAGLCSGGKMVGFLGQGHTVTCTAQTAADGTYRLTLFYITQDTRRLYIQVNGGEKVYHELQGNGFSWNSDGMAMRTFSVQLKKGDNTICLGNDEGYAPNIDRMVLSPAPTSHTLAVGTLTPCTDGVYGAETDIALTVTNPTDQPISDVQLAYQVDDQPVVTETLPLLPAAQATVYTFAHKADLSAMGTHRLRAWTVTDDARLLDGDLATASLFALPAGEQNVSAASAGGTIHSKSAQVSDGEGADKLLDGDDATKWCDNASAEPWVVVALPHACMVGHFLIRDCKTREQGFHNLSDYKIYVTADDDPSTALWTCVVDAQGAQADDIHIHALPQPVAARYVKLVAQRPEGDNAIRLYAFDVYGTSADTPSGIGAPTASAATSATVYNMAGQRMATATRGLKPGVYVVDGKKMVVRFK